MVLREEANFFFKDTSASPTVGQKAIESHLSPIPAEREPLPCIRNTTPMCFVSA